MPEDFYLTCYQRDDWNLCVRPASPKREWMDRSQDAFAYRCLPLNIANAHGWEILNPINFAAQWVGGNGIDAVKIVIDPRAGASLHPVSTFGSGVLTFHINGLFRTPPGWNLMVGPSPNRGKDGIYGLTGVIETDWSPYTFTMNWQFTRVGQWVRFIVNEPICFIQPVQRGILEQFTPRFVPLRDEADTARQFEEWSKSRNDFLLKMSRSGPIKPANSWQKRYYQGLNMDDIKAKDHKTSTRLKEFKRGA